MASILMWLSEEAFADVLEHHGGYEREAAQRAWNHTHGLMEDLNKQRMIRVSHRLVPGGEMELRFSFLITKSNPPVPVWLTLRRFKELCARHSKYDEAVVERTFKRSAGILLTFEAERVRVTIPPPPFHRPDGLCHNPLWVGWTCAVCGEEIQPRPQPVFDLADVEDPDVLDDIEVKFYLRFL